MVITSKNPDLTQLIHDIERLKQELAGPGTDQAVAGIFIQDHGSELIALLKDLRRRRTTDSHGIHNRVLLEGYSEESLNAALSDALGKAAHYFSEQHDIRINLLELLKLRRGGYRALMEIHITPLTLRNRLKYQGQDVELKHIHEHDYKTLKKHEQEQMKHLIFDHFAVTTGDVHPEIPDYFLININDAMLLNFMLEKAFFNAGHNISASAPVPTPTIGKPTQILVRVVKPVLQVMDDPF